MKCVHGRPTGAECPSCYTAPLPALPPVFPGMRWAPPPAVVVPAPGQQTVIVPQGPSAR